MEVTEKMYFLAKEIVKEYEKNIDINEMEIIDPFQVSLLDQIEEKEVKTLTLAKENEFSLDVLNCYRVITDYFTENLHPNKPKSWYETIDKLNRIDGYSFQDIELVVKSVRDDDFWSRNFLSILKLRRKNKDGVMYFKVFVEKFKKIEKPKTINRQTKDVIAKNISNW